MLHIGRVFPACTGAAYLIAGGIQSVHASEAPAADTPLSEIVVTASRSGSTVSELPISVTLIDSKTLGDQLTYSDNIMRAMEYAVPGLAPQQEGRSNCSPNIRGRATSIQINGIPVNEELRESTCDQMYQLSPFAIEQVEVLRGGTALYGAGSPGGIINFITRRAASADMEFDTLAQTSFNSAKAKDTFATDVYLGAGQKLSTWDYYLGAAYTDAGAGRTPDGGFVPTREYDNIAFNGSLGAQLAGGDLRVTGTWYREEKDQQYSADGLQAAGVRYANVAPIASHPQIGQNVLRSGTLLVGYSHPEVLGQELSLSAYYQDQQYRQRDNLGNLAFGNAFFASDSEHSRTGFRSTLTKRTSLGSVGVAGSYGFDFTNNRYYRPVTNAATGAITGFVAPETILDTYAAFGQGEVNFGRWRLVGGVRQEWYRGEVGRDGYRPGLSNVATPGDFGDSDLALYNIGAIVDLTATMQLYGGFSQGAELSELGRAARGINDPSRITPEPATSDQYELGVRGRSDSLRYELVAFRSTSDKAALLQPDPSCAGQSLCPLIPLRSPQRFWGVEASAAWSATRQLDLNAVVTWQRGEIFDEDLGRYIEYSTDTVTPFRVSAAAQYRPIERLHLSLQGAYHGAADYYSPSEQALGFINTDEVFLMDASAACEIGAGRIYLAASNLLDKRYVNVANQGLGDFFYYRAQGRRMTLGYKARF